LQGRRRSAAQQPIGRDGRQAQSFVCSRPDKITAWKTTVGRFQDETPFDLYMANQREMNNWGRA
jgi:hypothetical protein